MRAACLHGTVTFDCSSLGQCLMNESRVGPRLGAHRPPAPPRRQQRAGRPSRRRQRRRRLQRRTALLSGSPSPAAAAPALRGLRAPGAGVPRRSRAEGQGQKEARKGGQPRGAGCEVMGGALDTDALLLDLLRREGRSRLTSI